MYNNMKNFILIILMVFGVASYGQQYTQHIKNADDYYSKGEYATAVKVYEQAFAIKSGNSSDLYNAACTAALADQNDKAFTWLNAAIDKGWTNVPHLKSDGDLKGLYTDKRWDKTVAKAQQKLTLQEAKVDKPLQELLHAIYDDDQLIRQQYITAQKQYGFDSKIVDSLGKVMVYKDSINLRSIVKILDSRGWLGSDIVGARGNQTFFLVVQHSDLATQQKYLPMMRDAVKKGNGNPASLALLEDRIALREGKKQIYGSQVGRNPQTNEYYVLPLDDPDNVDKRRAMVGLGSLAEYIANWELIWDVEAYKKSLPAYEALAKEKR